MSEHKALALAAGWRDVSAQRRDVVRTHLRLGLSKLRARAGEGATMAEIRADAARAPDEYFICANCGTGPWHVSWGDICGNCSGAD